MNFGRMNDNYYTPADDSAWDYFLDYCEENDLDPEAEDFEQWKEDQREAAEERASEAAWDAYNERDWEN